MFYDDDVVVDGDFDIVEKTLPDAALDQYEEGTKVRLSYRPFKELTYMDDSSYGIYNCKLNTDSDNPPEFIVSGYLSDRLDIGHTYTSDGTVVTTKGNKQFRIDNISQQMPDCGSGVLDYLRSLNWIRSGADTLYETFGADALRIIREDPSAVKKTLPDVTDERIDEWQRQIENGRDDLGFLSELISIGLKPRQARQLIEKYGADTMNKVRTNPYCLIGRVPGYTFAKCDEAAVRLKLEPDCAERMTAGVNSAMMKLMSGGSTKIRRDEAQASVIDTLSVRMTVSDMYDAVNSGKAYYEASFGSQKWKIPCSHIKADLTMYKSAKTQADRDQARTLLWYMSPPLVKETMDNMLAEGELVADGEYIMLKRYYTEEHEVASSVIGLIDAAEKNTVFDVEAALNAYCKEKGIVLEERQRDAVTHVCSSIGGLHIINGAAGCGKTFCIKVALAILEQMYHANGRELIKTIVAPTGKAARVAHNSTGIDASTVHRLLQYRADGTFYYNATNKLDYNCLVIDETSMLDTNIAYSLFTAIAPGTIVILMGDINQLPSIGPGNVLHDLTSSGIVDVVTLNVIKRQGKDSGIVINARHVIDGEPVTTQKETMDSLVVGADTEPAMLDKMLKYVEKSLAGGKADDLQILAPMRSGLIGTNNINRLMQQRLNPNAADLKPFLQCKFSIEQGKDTRDVELYFRCGDRVINTKNDYSIPWFCMKQGRLYTDGEKCGLTNGEVGTIVWLGNDIDTHGDKVNRMIVRFPADKPGEFKYVIFDNDFQVLSLSYAITIHRSQGSEWPVVLVMLSRRHKKMIDRHLLYTGITRSKAKCILISDKETLDYAVSCSKGDRVTGLRERIIEFASGGVSEPNRMN